MTNELGQGNVYALISQVQKKLCEQGISKDQLNKGFGGGGSFKYRGIDDVYNAISPILAEFGLNILPRYSDRTVTEQSSKSGGLLFYTVVRGEFDFVSSFDGTMHTIVTYGEAMDSGDKSTNKAMSAALKYACFQAFMIPTEGDNDADASTHEVKKTTTENNVMPPEIGKAYIETMIGKFAELGVKAESLEIRVGHALSFLSKDEAEYLKKAYRLVAGGTPIEQIKTISEGGCV